MTLSVRERIVRRVLERLTVALAPVPVLRPPTAPITREAGVTALVIAESDRIETQANALVDRTLTIRLSVVAHGPDAFDDADHALVRAHAELMRDANLGGLALAVREVDADWETEDLDAGSVAMPARYEIRYRTQATDITVPG